MKNLYGPKLDVESVTDIETRKLAGDLTPLDRQVQLEMDKQAMQLRADLLNRGYKGLAWINAGGAAALTTWVQAVWDKPSALVFTRTRHGAKKLVRQLYEAGRPAAELHGNRTPSQRTMAMEAFRSGRVKLMVATNIAARGIDVKNVTHVVNFEVPDAPEDYVHRIGRTGRAGASGDALILYSPEESHDLAQLERRLRQPIERRHADDVVAGRRGPAPEAPRLLPPAPSGRGGPPRRRQFSGPARRR